MQRPTCIAVDFDGTLASFRGDSFFEIFYWRGVPHEQVEECFDETKKGFGFSPKEMVFVVERKIGRPLDRDAIVGEFDGWLAKSLFGYPDSVAKLTEWQQAGIRVVILTTGDMEFQVKKIDATGMPHDKILVVTQDEGKLREVHWLLERCGAPILLIEDNPEVLDLVREGQGELSGLSESQVVTVRLLRQESRHRAKASRYNHEAVSSLEEIQF